MKMPISAISTVGSIQCSGSSSVISSAPKKVE